VKCLRARWHLGLAGCFLESVGEVGEEALLVCGWTKEKVWAGGVGWLVDSAEILNAGHYGEGCIAGYYITVLAIALIYRTGGKEQKINQLGSLKTCSARREKAVEAVILGFECHLPRGIVVGGSI
jgi:hypothetical protein